MKMTFRPESLLPHLDGATLLYVLLADENVSAEVAADVLATGNGPALPELIIDLDLREGDWDFTREIRRRLTRATPGKLKPARAAEVPEDGTTFSFDVDSDTRGSLGALVDAATGRGDGKMRAIVYKLIPYLTEQQLIYLRGVFREEMEKQREEDRQAS